MLEEVVVLLTLQLPIQKEVTVVQVEVVMVL